MNRIKNQIFEIFLSKIGKRKPVFFMAFLLPFLANAQAFIQETSKDEMILILVMGMVFVVLLIVLGVAFYALTILRIVIGNEKKDSAKAQGIAYKPEPGFWQKLWGTEVPVEEEATLLLNHNYDGIKELDNHLPPWWKYLFYLSIVFAVAYVFIYHISGALPLQLEEYNTELLIAEKQAEQRQLEAGNSIDENNVEFSDETGIISNGKEIYAGKCVACHATDGGGGVGPNLTDEYWIHGGSIKSIFKTIKYGVPQKGMISWQNQLTPSDIRDVASYIVTIKGAKTASPKEPQGEIYVEE
ncbi:cbb3-type cytochrome c oxidase N-terminal domain-containing protein [Reichenbachiella sp. MALMAid0571]|uniref:cbb3-type cytochrome c oxidase N-terminal domain-containing protein n=1 Tax=Reichenbachiella sp. MALMAid0571 TaxID=3143939 RepID=UPI0032DE4E58